MTAPAVTAWSATRISARTCAGRASGPYGGFAEFLPVPARYVIKVDKRLEFEELAPLTDAGLTPYRGIKKLRDAGALGPNRVMGVFGIGGLGAYAVQYAKLLGGGATVVAFARNVDKLAVAKEHGVDHAITIKGKTAADIAKELGKATGQSELDAVIDCTGAPGDGAAGLRPAIDQRPLCRCGAGRRSHRHSAVPAGLARADPPRLVLGKQHGPDRGHGAGRPRQDPSHHKAIKLEQLNETSSC